MHPRPTLWLLFVLGTAPALLHPAQAQTPDTTLGDKLLAHAVLPPPYTDTLVLLLHRNGQYRLAVLPPDTRVRIVPLVGHGEAFVARTRLGTGGRSTIFEIAPFSTGAHAVVVTPANPTDTVELWAWADSAKEAQYRARRDRQWGIGIQVALGYHSGYRTQASDPPAAASGDYEAGVLVGSSGRLGILLGVRYDPRYTGTESITSAFAEPRLRLERWRLGHRAVTFVVTARIAQGNSSPVAVDPSYYGVGALFAYQLDTRPGNRGWRVGVHISECWVHNVPVGNGSPFTHGALTLSWLP